MKEKDVRKKAIPIESAILLGVGLLCFVGAFYFGFTEGIKNGGTYAILGVALLAFRQLIKQE